MARVPYISEAEAVDVPGLGNLYADIIKRRGRLLNLHKALANQPPALRAFMGMSRYVRDDSSLDPAIRELAILATAYAVDAEYEKYHHIPIARRLGVSEVKLAAFPRWQDSPEFSATERSVLEYADGVARTRSADNVTFRALELHFTKGQIVELAMTVAWYHFVAAILGPLGIEVEDR